MNNIIRDKMLDGNNPIPYESYEGFSEYKTIARMCESLWRMWLRNPANTLAIPYWNDQFHKEKVFRGVLKNLVRYGWVESKIIPNAHWGEFRLYKNKLLSLCSEEELGAIRAKYKYCTYSMNFSESNVVSLTKSKGKIRHTGLTRVGFAKLGNTQFGFDTTKMEQHKEAIKRNLIKGMQKVRNRYPDTPKDIASYDEVAKGVLDNYMSNREELYTTGNNFSDSRGRANSTSLSCIGNPIGSKDMRALLVITY